MKIACVAVVGKQNNPLYIRSFDPLVEGLKFHYVVHTALDVIEDRDSAPPPTPTPNAPKPKGNDMYMGLLCPTEDYRVYGYVTNTKNKLIVVLDDYDVKEHDIKSFFKAFHSIFADANLNPFYTPDEKISGKQFDRQLVQLVKKRSPDSQ
eukprot:TRINITY_DN18200_c0_g1_i1.p1 TRINITY_DN18200_c0_g1~~TRINITY_DN18200_c0_g1_i1.p1  ORF type:complete len:157 (-),score=15.79 TRINITY_DN18200_c0_g1_i1:48-497(-)